jgi:hypothetical protein
MEQGNEPGSLRPRVISKKKVLKVLLSAALTGLDGSWRVIPSQFEAARILQLPSGFWDVNCRDKAYSEML